MTHQSEGKNKPIQTEEERKLQLSEVEYVDEVIVYDTEEDLVGLLIEIKADERYVGSDWKDNPNLTGGDLDIPIHYNSRDHVFFYRIKRTCTNYYERTHKGLNLLIYVHEGILPHVLFLNDVDLPFI